MFWMLKMYITQSPLLYAPAGRSLLQPPEVSKNKICSPCLLPSLNANPDLYLSCKGLSRKGSALNLSGIKKKPPTSGLGDVKTGREFFPSCSVLISSRWTLRRKTRMRLECLIDCGTYYRPSKSSETWEAAAFSLHNCCRNPDHKGVQMETGVWIYY